MIWRIKGKSESFWTSKTGDILRLSRLSSVMKHHHPRHTNMQSFVIIIPKALSSYLGEGFLGQIKWNWKRRTLFMSSPCFVFSFVC